MLSKRKTMIIYEGILCIGLGVDSLRWRRTVRQVGREVGPDDPHYTMADIFVITITTGTL